MANDVATTQDALYQQAVSEHANALKRLARAYESDPEIRRDLLQEIHVALWLSFADFGRLCSMRTRVFCWLTTQPQRMLCANEEREAD